MCLTQDRVNQYISHHVSFPTLLSHDCMTTDMYGFRFASIVLLATAVLADNLPACAQSCVTNYNGCSQFDVACICGSSAWISGLACCVSKVCSASDQQGMTDLDGSRNVTNRISHHQLRQYYLRRCWHHEPSTDCKLFGRRILVLYWVSRHHRTL